MKSARIEGSYGRSGIRDLHQSLANSSQIVTILDTSSRRSLDQPVFPPSFPPRSAGTSTNPPSPASPSQAASTPAASTPDLRGAEGSPSLETILRIADKAGHSDVHLGVGERPDFRACGDIQTTDWPTTDEAVFQGWLREILSPQQIGSFYRNKELDSAFAFPIVRVRINLLDSLHGPAMVLRLIP